MHTKHNNQLSVSEWVIYNVVYCFMYISFYNYLLFTPIVGIGAAASRKLFFVLALGGNAFTFVLNANHRRTPTALLTGCLLGLSIYHLLSYYAAYKYVYHASFLIGVICCGWCVLKHLLRTHEEEEPWRCLSEKLLTVLSFTLIAVVGLSLLCVICTGSPIPSMREPITYSEKQSAYDDEHSAILLPIYSDALWEDTELSQRLGLLQQIINLETDKQGMAAVSVCAKAGAQNDWAAYYDGTSRCLYVNADYLASTDRNAVLRTVLTAFHDAYRQSLIALYEAAPEKLAVLWEAKIYAEELYDGTYRNSDSKSTEYAKGYASRITLYLDAVEEYIRRNNLNHLLEEECRYE